MKIVLTLGLFLLAVYSAAQDPKVEINEDVWIPFINAFNNNDTKSFMQLHSKDVIRSPRDSKKILNWHEYFLVQEQGDNADKAAHRKRNLELRFTERLANNERAIEVGIYKTSYLNDDGSTSSFYGRFHVVLRKENGKWKILVDTDSSENNTISEKEFLSASNMK